MLSLALVPLLVASALASDLIAEQHLEPLPQYTQEQNTATGEYGYSYSGGPSSKTEFRALDGTTTGAYSYVDAHGILQTVNYIADEFGFRAAGSNIPVDGAVPLDAPDVAAAKAAHLAEHSRATLAALSHQRKKRSLAVLPLAHALPLATSSQSRFQIHNGARIITHQPAIIAPAPAFLLRKKRGLFAPPPLPLLHSATLLHRVPEIQQFKSISHILPLATSSQSRFQIHHGAKIIQELHQPLFAPIKTEFIHHQPIYQPIKHLPEFQHEFAGAPAAPIAPAAPAQEAVIAENDAIAVESA